MKLILEWNGRPQLVVITDKATIVKMDLTDAQYGTLVDETDIEVD